MKRILRLDEDDILKVVAKHFGVRPNQVTSIYTDVEDEKTGEIETKFYIEVEDND